VQETGRGGRDGEKAECILYYRDQDVECAKAVLNINTNLSNFQGHEDDAIFKLEAVRRVSTFLVQRSANIVGSD
jgi:superfamily II DNA helicase RecQ